MASDWLAEAIATRDVERVKANMAAAGERVNDARRHVRSARVLADDDTTLAMAACHDAIRKAVTAHMAANGLRARGGDGAHRITPDYARQTLAGKITTGDLEEADEIRQDRALAEYGDFASRKLNAAHVRAAAHRQCGRQRARQRARSPIELDGPPAIICTSCGTGFPMPSDAATIDVHELRFARGGVPPGVMAGDEGEVDVP